MLSLIYKCQIKLSPTQQVEIFDDTQVGQQVCILHQDFPENLKITHSQLRILETHLRECWLFLIWYPKYQYLSFNCNITITLHGVKHMPKEINASDGKYQYCEEKKNICENHCERFKLWINIGRKSTIMSVITEIII